MHFRNLGELLFLVTGAALLTADRMMRVIIPATPIRSSEVILSLVHMLKLR